MPSSAPEKSGEAQVIIMARRESDQKAKSVLIDASGVRSKIHTPHGPEKLSVLRLDTVSALPFCLPE